MTKKTRKGRKLECDVCGGRHLCPSGILTQDVRLRCLMGRKNQVGQLERLYRSVVKQRDGYECQRCGTQQQLQVHHVIRRGHSKKLQFELLNGLTLCDGCHIWWHGNEVDAGIWFLGRWADRYAALTRLRQQYAQEPSRVPREYWWTLHEELKSRCDLFQHRLDRQGVEWQQVSVARRGAATGPDLDRGDAHGAEPQGEPGLARQRGNFHQPATVVLPSDELTQ